MDQEQKNANSKVEVICPDDLDISWMLQKLWEIFQDDLQYFLGGAVALTISIIVSSLLSMVVIGIPLLAMLLVFNINYMHGIVRKMRGEHVELKDIADFDQFGNVFIVTFLTALIIAVGAFFLIIPGLSLAAILMYAPLLAKDRKLGISEALKTSKEVTLSKGFWPHLVVVLLSFVVGIVLSWVPIVGGIISLFIISGLFSLSYYITFK